MSAVVLTPSPNRDPGLRAGAERIERVVATARETLGMDVAYVGAITDATQRYDVVDGDGPSFGLAPGTSGALQGTYCDAMLGGRLANLVPDARADAVASGLPVTASADVGAYLGVPVVLPDGELFGTFCCFSHQPRADLREREVRLMETLAQVIADQVVHERRQAGEHRRELTEGAIRALVVSLETRDGYTEEHSRAVVDLAQRIGVRLGLGDHELNDLEVVALLHDIGKLGVPDAILHKPGPLDPAEWAEMRRHPDVGADLIGTLDPLRHLAPAIRAEHERWDGKGYPQGLAGEEIPVLARIVLIADAVHAMTSDRPYRPALATGAALAELERHAGSQFWPQGAEAALELLREPVA